jgi:hypothetical protein
MNELRKHKPYFDEASSKLLDQRKDARLHSIKYLSEIKGDNLNNKRREDRSNSRKEKKEYLNEKSNRLAVKSKYKNIRDMRRGINEMRKG